MEQRETLTMEQRLLLFPCFPNASDAEIEVAKILINLPHMISEFKTPIPIPLELVWGCKGKRSALAMKNDGGASTLRRLIGPDFLSSLPLGGSLAPLPLAAKAPPPPPVPNAVKEETSSPDTPLCFEPQPSESDEKQPDDLRSKLRGKKRKTEELITIVDELTSKKKLRNQELENVKRFFEKMDGLNLELKARKEELMRLGHKQEKDPFLDTDLSPEPAEQLNQPTQLISVTPAQAVPNQELCQHPQEMKMPMPMPMQIPPPPSVIFYQHQLKQLITDQTAKNQRREFNVGPGGGHGNLCFKDSIVLNSSQPFDIGLVNKDMIRKRAAEARQKRLEICRVKKPRFHSR